MSESTQVNGYTEPKSPEAAALGRGQPEDDQFDATLALLRLLLGGTLIGADEVRLRLRQWEAVTRSAPKTSSPYSPANSPRHALVGMLFETETRMRRRFSATLKRFSHVSSEAEYLFYTTLRPTLRHTPLDPLLERLDDLVFMSMVMVDRWAVRGWSEEQQGRRMAQQAAVSVVDELIGYMARNPQVRELIEQQGLGMAGSAMDEVRGRTATADMWIERLAHNLLHRPVNEKLAKPAGDVEAPALAAEVPPPPGAAISPLPTPEAKGRTPSSTAKTAKTQVPAAPGSGR